MKASKSYVILASRLATFCRLKYLNVVHNIIMQLTNANLLYSVRGVITKTFFAVGVCNLPSNIFQCSTSSVPVKQSFTLHTFFSVITKHQCIEQLAARNIMCRLIMIVQWTRNVAIINVKSTTSLFAIGYITHKCHHTYRWVHCKQNIRISAFKTAIYRQWDFKRTMLFADHTRCV
jgi:hypothetical protein